MSSSHFQLFKHTIPCQHIREYPRGTKRKQEEVLQLSINQYKPVRYRESEGGVTIIATHANGFPKEAYEPLWDDLLQLSEKYGFKIRGIWMADMSNQGASGMLNENKQGDDPSYFDHSRDLLHMINTFREQMPRPLIGIGHSLGASQMLGLSIMHPRLLTSLILMEPIIQRAPPSGPNVALSSSYRPDIWPSHSAASAAFRKNKFFSQLDPRVLENFIKHGLRQIPTALYPVSANAKEGSYTLTTTKHQEVWSFLRANFDTRDPITSGSRNDRLLFPDMNVDQKGKPFYRGELGVAFEYLAYLRPSVLFVFGAKSYLSSPESQDEKMRRTGTGIGGSGGVERGEVEKYVFEKGGHMVPLEDVGGCADVIGEWVGRKMRQFGKDEEVIESFDAKKSEMDMLMVSKEWLEKVRLPFVYPKSGKAKL